MSQNAVDLGMVSEETANAVPNFVMKGMNLLAPYITLPYTMAKQAGAFDQGVPTGMQGGIPAAQAAAHAHAVNEAAANEAAFIASYDMAMNIANQAAQGFGAPGGDDGSMSLAEAMGILGAMGAGGSDGGAGGLGGLGGFGTGFGFGGFGGGQYGGYGGGSEGIW
jgi:hypothetical protein